MVRFICGLALILLIASPSFGQQSLVGTYKLVSQVVETGGTPTEPYGKAPQGYLVMTPTRAVIFYTAANRKFGMSVDDKAALFETMTGWAGVYRLEESKLIIRVDASWVENWNGKDQVRNWALSGNRLTLTSDPMPWARDPSKMVVVRQAWEKVE
jgi:hypothetical protein